MRRTATIAFFFLLVVVLGGLAWLTRNPDAEILERAETWPVVGELAARFRSAYLPPEPESSAPVTDEGPEIVWIPAPGEHGRGAPEDRGEVAEAPSSPVSTRPVYGALPFVWVPEGTRLFERDRTTARHLHRYEEPERLTVIEQRGDWYRVMAEAGPREGPIGWVHLPDYTETSDPPLGSEPRRLVPVEAQAPDPGLLESARALLTDERQTRLGPYAGYVDGADGELLDWLDRIAGSLEATYARRYHLELVGRPREAVVLFATEDAYRAFQSDEARIADLSSGGHAFRGLAVTWTGDRPDAQTAGVLVHELTHLLNRRGVGPALPPWLDEGLAEDLAISELGPTGSIDANAIGGSVRELPGGTRVMHGGWASVRLLKRELGRPGSPRLEQILTEDWDAFVRTGDREYNYAYVGLFLRYLQRPGSGDAAALRAFLASVANGAPATGDALLSRLGRPAAELEVAFADWVRRQPSGPRQLPRSLFDSEN